MSTSTAGARPPASPNGATSRTTAKVEAEFLRATKMLNRALRIGNRALLSPPRGAGGGACGVLSAGCCLLLLMWGCKPSSEGETAEKDPFNENVVTTYEITIDPADWNSMVADPESNVWRRMTLVWEGETFKDVAVHPSGQHSRMPGNPKPSLHLSFEEFVPSRHFHHLPSLKLNSHIDDPALMRERLTYGLARAFGVVAPREVHARVVVNGVYLGLYGAEERVTKKFVKDNFGGEANQVYKFSG